MNWSGALNVAIGLTLVYLAFSVAASRINEFVASQLQWRADGLERALYTMLGGPKASPSTSVAVALDGEPVVPAAPAQPQGFAQLSAQAVKNYPAIAAMESVVGKNRRISYLPSRAFSAAVLDILVPPAVVVLDSIANQVPPQAEHAFAELRSHPDTAHFDQFTHDLPADNEIDKKTLRQIEVAIKGDPVEQLQAAIKALPATNPARRTLLRMATDAGESRDAFRAKLEHWYDDEMSRITGWYKRYVQRWIIAFGVALTILFNVDTLSITDALWRSPVEQAAVAQAATTATGKTLDQVDTSVAAINSLALPVGWAPPHEGNDISNDPRRVPLGMGPWLLKLLGWLITAAALTFGAPFWFDVLGKLARVRNAGGVASTTEDGKRT